MRTHVHVLVIASVVIFCGLIFNVVATLASRQPAAPLAVTARNSGASAFPGGALPGATEEEANPYTSNLRITSKFSQEDFVPDGKLEKKVWRRAKRVSFNRDWSGREEFPRVETHVASLWTATSVYFAFWCTYTNLSVFEGEDPAKERWRLWERDVVEVYLHPRPEVLKHYYEFQVSPNNQWADLQIDLNKTPHYDLSWSSYFQHATRVDTAKHIWSCEIRIPLGPMQVSAINPNSGWRMNFYRNTDVGDSRRRRSLAWSPILGVEKTNFHVPTRFGIIQFLK
jgi:hypothetical protein